MSALCNVLVIISNILVICLKCKYLLGICCTWSQIMHAFHGMMMKWHSNFSSFHCYGIWKVLGEMLLIYAFYCCSCCMVLYSMSEIWKVFIWWYVWNHVSTFQVFMIIEHEKFGVKCCGYVGYIAVLGCRAPLLPVLDLLSDVWFHWARGANARGSTIGRGKSSLRSGLPSP